MGSSDEWSPDEPMGTETFRQGDVAEDESERLSQGFREDLEGDPSLSPAMIADEAELEEIGAQLDDPEVLVTMQGGMDDPDGIGMRPPPRSADDEGWDLERGPCRERARAPMAARAPMMQRGMRSEGWEFRPRARSC